MLPFPLLCPTRAIDTCFCVEVANPSASHSIGNRESRKLNLRKIWQKFDSFFENFRTRRRVHRSMGHKSPLEDGDVDLSPYNFRTTRSLAERSMFISLLLRDHPFDSLHSPFLSPRTIIPKSGPNINFLLFAYFPPCFLECLCFPIL